MDIGMHGATIKNIKKLKKIKFLFLDDNQANPVEKREIEFKF
jgi:hypothetical protein